MKIFGIGMQRTGTTSLATALSSLGFKTLDYPKELFLDIDHEVIRQHDAFTDNPIPLLYRELDRRYPGSKFILTTRSEDDWLKSVHWLFTVGREKFNPPLVDEIHQALYGTTRFDEAVFRERFRRHHHEVEQHFAARRHDLLVLDITQGEGFDKLCAFLGCPAPASSSFPHRNRAESVWRVRARKLYWRVRTKLGSVKRALLGRSRAPG